MRGRSVGRRSSILHCSHVLLFATLERSARGVKITSSPGYQRRLQSTYFERDAVLGRWLELLAPVQTKIDVDFTEWLETGQVRLTTVLAGCSARRCRCTTQSRRLQHAVQLLPRLLVVGLDVQLSLDVVHGVHQQTLHRSHAAIQRGNLHHPGVELQSSSVCSISGWVHPSTSLPLLSFPFHFTLPFHFLPSLPVRPWSFLHPLGVPNFRITPSRLPLLSDNPSSPNSSQEVLPNIVIGIVIIVHQPLKTSPPSDTRGLPRPDPRPEFDTPSYQILDNTLFPFFPHYPSLIQVRGLVSAVNSNKRL